MALNLRRPEAVVLIYHRVTSLDSDPQLLAVNPSSFYDQLLALKKHYNIVSLQELHHQMCGGRLAPKTVVITFDDGYEDNYACAAEILQECSLPATFFVSTGLINRLEEFWWDNLERIFLLPGTLPKRLALNIHDKSYEWTFDETSRYSDDDFARLKSWNVLDSTVPTERHRSYKELCALLRYLNGVEQIAAQRYLSAWAGVSTEGRASHRVLSISSVKATAESNIIEVGAHTANHIILSSLTLEEQSQEIMKSKAEIEQIISRPVKSFAYPYGGHGDYNAQTIRILKDAGFNLACSNFPGLVCGDTDSYEIPRIIVRNWSGDQLLKRLGEYVLD